MDRYASARKLHALRTALDATGGLTVYDVMERFGVSRHTAMRWFEALEAAGEPLVDDTIDGRKVYRLMPGARADTVRMTTGQMVSLFLSRAAFQSLQGTGLKEDLDEVFEKLEKTLKKKDASLARNLERKFWDVNEARHLYEGRAEIVNEIVSALLADERLEASHIAVGAPDTRFVLEPYTLLLYKKGLYVAGFSDYHKTLRTFALDGFRDADRMRGEKFVYPAEYHPSQVTGGAFGIIGGPRTTVKIVFDAKVARYVQRRMWHPSQVFAPRDGGGVELTMVVAGTTEIVSWLLSFGETAEIVEPTSLREEVRAVVDAMARRYDAQPAVARRVDDAKGGVESTPAAPQRKSSAAQGRSTALKGKSGALDGGPGAFKPTTGAVQGKLPALGASALALEGKRPAPARAARAQKQRTPGLAR